MIRRSIPFVLVLALASGACADRPPAAPAAGSPDALAQAPPAAAARLEGLARAFARALASPEFRGYVRSRLDGSPYREHKLPYQRFLETEQHRAARAIARASATTADEVERGASAAIPLEFYLPVPAHRAAWTGDDHVLVATAVRDGDVPVAFDPAGRRYELDAGTPPATPVIALVPVETDFDTPSARAECGDPCPTGGGGGTVADTTGLYMTKAHFVQDFESWLKGDPEFELHILGQVGQSDSLTTYQCAGEHAGGPYAFDQNGLDWSGKVLLFSQTQLRTYRTQHPGQSVRVFALEDDDGACAIRTDRARFTRLLRSVDSAYALLTGGRDSIVNLQTAFRAATALQRVIAGIANLITTNDDLIGDAVEDRIVGTFYPGYNWFIKGENTINNGWVNLAWK